MMKFCAKALSLAALSVLGGAAAAQQPQPTVHPAPMQATMMPAQGCGNGNHWAQPAGNCGGCADDCCGSRGGLYAEASILYLKPRWDNNEAYRIANLTPNGINLDSESVSTNFDMKTDFMPRLVIGYGIGDGFGARVRWSQGKWDQTLFAATEAASPIAGDPFDTVTTASPLSLGLSSQEFRDGNGDLVAVGVSISGELRVLTWDVEATKEAKICGFNVTFSGGLRYLHISQDYNAAMEPDGADFLVASFLTSGHNINGVGPTFAIDARAPLTGGFAAYGIFRSSIIFADGTQSAARFDVNQTFEGEVITFSKVYQERDTVIPIGELEVGGEYTCSMGNSELFARAGLVGQVYFGAGNTSRSGDTANELNSNLGLLGVNFTVGLRY